MSTETNHSDFDRELLSACVDGELTGAERAAVDAHLASDPAARQQVEAFRRLSGLIQNLPQPSLPADFSARVIARAEQVRPASEVEPLRPGLTIGRTWRGWVWAGAALAAALLLAIMLPNREPELANRGIAISSPAMKEQPEMRAPLGSASLPLERSDSSSGAEQLPRSGGRAEESPLSQEQLSVPEALLTDGDPLSGRAYESGADESPLLIVRVSMSAAALQGRALDLVLAQNGIDVEETQELASPPDKAEAVEESAAGQPAAVQAYADAESAGVAEGEEAELKGAFARPREVVLVDAPLEQIAASLASIEGDAENFVALEIEQGSPLSKQRSSIVNDQVDQLRRFNRAAVAGRDGAARESDVSGPSSSERGLASNERSLEEPEALAAAEPAGQELSQAAAAAPPPADAAPALAPATPPPPRESESPRRETARGRAYRYLSVDGMKRKLESLARRRGQLPEELAELKLGVRGGSAADPRVRVLFVLEETPPAAAPEAIKAAEPVKPPR